MPDPSEVDSESDCEDAPRYEPIECWHPQDTTTNQTSAMAFSQVTSQRVTSSSDGSTSTVEEQQIQQQQQMSAKSARKGRKISAQFQAFKSGIMNRFQSTEKPASRSPSESSDRRGSTSSSVIDSPDSAIESDVKPTSSTTSSTTTSSSMAKQQMTSTSLSRQQQSSASSKQQMTSRQQTSATSSRQQTSSSKTVQSTTSCHQASSSLFCATSTDDR